MTASAQLHRWILLLHWVLEWARVAFPSGCHAASKRLLLGSLQEWPACLRMCGIVPEGSVEIGGMDHDSDGASGAKSLIECPKTGS